MDTKTASDLIELLWSIGAKLKTIQRDLDTVEYAIADEVEDE